MATKEAEAGTVSVRHESKGEIGPRPLAELSLVFQNQVSFRVI
jgi:hypothetical protein